MDVSKKISFNFKPSFLNRVSTQDKVDFTRHLAATIKSGIPLVEALKLIQSQTSSKNFVGIIGQVITDINNGQTLSKSFGRFGPVFGDFFISIVGVGEASGNLAASLLYISSELKKQREINSKVKSAMVYPAVVLVATLAMALFLTIYIFPQILPVFTSLRVELPITTRIMIKIFVFLGSYYIHTIVGIILSIIVLKILFSMKKFHFFYDKMILSVPVVGELIVHMTMANFSRSLGILLKSGMTIIDALSVTQSTFHNMYYRYHVGQIIEVVKRGEEIGRYLSEHPRLFPPMLVGMIKVGESTGNLEENLEYLSEYYTEELDLSVRNLTSLLEPLLILIMGLVVGFIALSIVTPIYSVTQGLKVR
jgi:type IV pilus assembly protein PilC